MLPFGRGRRRKKKPLLVNFYEKPTFRVWCLHRYLVQNVVAFFVVSLSLSLVNKNVFIKNFKKYFRFFDDCYEL
jgi:hypothetical protein